MEETDAKHIDWGLIVGAFAILIAIVAIILIFVIPGAEGPAGPAGTNGKDGKNGTNGTTGIMYSSNAVLYSPDFTYQFTLPTYYNGTNIVIPGFGNVVTPYVEFFIDVGQVSIGDIFMIDNSNNRNGFYIWYSGFDNQSVSPKKVVIDTALNSTGTNLVQVQITAGKSLSTKNIFLTVAPP